MNVMIVDDEPNFVEVLENKVEKEGYEVTKAYSGEECLERINEAPPDMILLDVMMPGIDGFEVCKRIKDEPKTKGIPVIMLSVKGEEKDVLKGSHMGALDYFPKPFNFNALVGKIDSILETKKTEEELELYARREVDREMGILTLKGRIKELKSELGKVRSGIGLGESKSNEDYLIEEKPKKKAPKKVPKS